MTDLKNKVWADVWPLSNEPLTYLCYSCFGTSGVFSCATCGSKGFLDAKDIAAIKRGKALQNLMTLKGVTMAALYKSRGVPPVLLSKYKLGQAPEDQESRFAALTAWLESLPDNPFEADAAAFHEAFPHVVVKAKKDEMYINGCMAQAVKLADEADPLTAVVLLRELIRDIETKVDENGNEYPGIYPYWNSIASYMKAKEFLETQP